MSASPRPAACTPGTHKAHFCVKPTFGTRHSGLLDIGRGGGSKIIGDKCTRKVDSTRPPGSRDNVDVQIEGAQDSEYLFDGTRPRDSGAGKYCEDLWEKNSDRQH